MPESLSRRPSIQKAELYESALAGARSEKVAWRETTGTVPAGLRIHEMFEAQVAMGPERVAVRHAAGEMSYGELNRRANALAWKLREKGVCADTLVAIRMRRSPELIVAMLGILKSGGAYLPLPVNAPEARIEACLRDSGARLAVVDTEIDGRQSGMAGIEVLTASWDDAEEECGDIPLAGGSHELAYVLYTSGSTGVPKGVAVEHRSVVALMHWARDVFADDELRWVLAGTPITFDISVFEIFAPLLWGGGIVLVEDILQCGGNRYWSSVTLVNTVPSLAKALLVQGVVPPPGVTVVLAGEALPTSLVDRLSEGWVPGRILDCYGPTETTVFSTWSERFPGCEATIGREVGGTVLHIVNESLQPVQTGHAGELLIGGRGLARGYLNRPELTAASFVEDHVGGEPRGRLYRTGDMVRRREDGLLEYLGRMDQQVKLRGLRIELGEIEAVLGSHAMVTGCAIAVDAHGETARLVAYVTAREGEEPELADLRGWLEARLPDYMIPARFVHLDELPITASGKLDRRALGSTTGRELRVTANQADPVNETERMLQLIWEEALRREHVGTQDDFFELGGHSLAATAIAAGIARETGVRVPIAWVFECRTVAVLSARIGDRDGQEIDVLVPTVADRRRRLAASSGQLRMWMARCRLPDPATYNVPVLYRITGALRHRRLKKSLVQLMHRHEILKTCLELDSEGLRQRIRDDCELEWEEIETSGGADNGMVAMRAAARRPFDLSVAPLWRVTVAVIGHEDRLLLLNFHHSVIDEWSLRLIIGELDRLYSAESTGGAAILPEVPLQFADFAAWQASVAAAPGTKRSEAWWQHQLSGYCGRTSLYTDRRPPAERTSAGAVERFHVGGNTVKSMRRIACAEGAALFSVVLCAWQVWLSRATGCEDLVVAIPATQRERHEFRNTAGFFLNTLPIRSRHAIGITFIDALRSTRESVLDAIANIAVSIEEIASQASGELTSGALHQIMFVLIEEGLPSWRAGEAAAVQLPIDTGTSKCDLLLTVTTAGGDWVCDLEYSTDLFSRERARVIANQFTAFLEALAEHPGQPMDELNSSPPHAGRWLPTGWRRDGAETRGAGVHWWFEAQAERNPEAVAAAMDDAVVTYGELNALAELLAQHLRGLGAGPDVPVGLMVERGLDLAVGVLGILKSGSACVPLDPSYPADRIAWMRRDAAVLVVVTKTELSGLLGRDAAVLLLDALSGGPRAMPCGVATRRSDLAYILYTSGSTGRPKGVAMEHGPLVNLVEWHRSQDSSPRRTLQYASLCFDVSFQEMFSAWSTGGVVEMISEEHRLDPTSLWSLILRREIERVFLPVVMLQQIAEAAGHSNERAPGLREVITSGESLRITPEIRRFFVDHEGCRLHNHYGPTETHVVTAWIMSGDPYGWPDMPPIGRPIANARIHLLDSAMHPVAPGRSGTVWVGGPVVARGYWRDDARTAERFLPDSVNAGEGSVLYCTGDLARVDDEGMLHFLGRGDNQVKVRGFRVEPGEIEAVLGRHDAVSGCAVVAQEDADGGRVLAAFLTLRGTNRVNTTGLREWLGESLPEHMIPQRFAALTSLPLTPNGKTDRQVLATLHPEWLPTGEDDSAVARTSAERKLADIWRLVLKREGIGVHDDFFALGGHSLLVMRMLPLIESAFGRTISPRVVFESRTISVLAGRIGCEGDDDHVSPIGTADRTQPLPASAGQLGLWIAQESSIDPAAGNVSVAYDVRGSVDLERLRNCLAVLAERHEVLRTSLHWSSGELRQSIHAPGEVPLPWTVHDLREYPEALCAQHAAHLAMEARCEPFVLSVPPLWRVIWVTTGNDRHRIAACFHHCIVDEWTLRMIFSEWALLYHGGALPPLKHQYVDYALWEREAFTGNLRERQRAWWAQELSLPSSALALPYDLSPPEARTCRVGVVRFDLPESLSTKLRDLAAGEGASLFVTMLSAWQAYLHRCTRQQDIVVATPFSLRSHPLMVDAAGYFLNTLPVRATIDPSGGFRALLNQVNDRFRGVVANSQLPYREVKSIASQRGHGDTLHQVLFVLLEEDLPALQLGTAEAIPLPSEPCCAICDLLLVVMAAGEDWRCELRYAADLFTREAAELHAGQFAEFLESVAGSPDRSIETANLLTAVGRNLLTEWNSTTRVYPCNQRVHEMFEDQVSRTPDAEALVTDERSMTYAELNCRANALARRLLRDGVSRGETVAICMERTPDAIAAFLAVLKAGGICLPLEMGYPAERRDFMMQDAGARFLVTHAAWVDRFPTETRAVIAADLNRTDVEASDATNPRVAGESGDAASVMYTSGSSGQPKGVLVAHRGIIRLVKNVEYVNLGPDETLLHAAPLGFDASTFEIWGGLLHGGRVVLMPPGLFSMSALGEAIRRHGVTTAWLTAGLFHQMVAERIDDLRPLRQLLAGGDVLSPVLVHKALAALPECSIINGYGPTESTTFACCHDLRSESGRSGPVPIGRPISNTCVHVVDGGLNQLPPGVPGELLIGGDGLALGYLNRPELTAERFICDPFSRDPAARLYRTGDMVRWRPDGALEFLGRQDRQVKIRGFRVELGDVEAAIEAHPLVDACAVIVTGLATERRMEAFMRISGREGEAASMMREWLTARLPDHMIPERISELPELPLNANGKVDREALAALDRNVQAKPKGSDVPMTALERRLAGIWQEVLGVPHVAPEDDFFSLGGHSIQAMRVASVIETIYGQRFPVAVLFHARTVRDLASWLLTASWKPRWNSLVPLKAGGTRPCLYFVHGWGGDVFGFLDVVRHLPANTRVFGIQATGLDGEAPRFASVEAMASYYADQVIDFQPDGPYCLAGYSLGGTFAYEVARQLELRGARVSFVGMFDSSPHGHAPVPAFVDMMLRRTAIHLGEILRHPERMRVDYLSGRIRSLWHWLSKRMDAIRRRHPAGNSSEPAIGWGGPDWTLELAASHVLRPYSGSVDVFEAADADRAGISMWRWLARGGVKFHRAGGQHLTMLSAGNAPALAELLVKAMRERIGEEAGEAGH